MLRFHPPTTVRLHVPVRRRGGVGEPSEDRWRKKFKGMETDGSQNTQGIVGCTPTNVPLLEIHIYKPYC